MKNGAIWLDNKEEKIQAHGGMILNHNGIYYWYGENKNGENKISKSGGRRVDFIGMSCYASTDLINWNYEGLVLEADLDNIDSDLHPSKVVERPKVIYNAKNDNFVMWLHVDDYAYQYAGVGVAISDSPKGPFKYLTSKNPNRMDSRDMTVFQDIDGKAYLIHSTDWNRSLCISQLNEDYTDFTGVYSKIFVDQFREAPAVVYHEGRYYMVTSGCTGWNPNAALYGYSDNLLSGWRLVDNPCMGKNYRITFLGQSTYILNINDKPYLMLDQWNPNDLRNSGYSILPIKIDGKYMEINWQDEFKGNIL